MKPLHEMTEPELSDLMKGIARKIKGATPEGQLFVLILIARNGGSA